MRSTHPFFSPTVVCLFASGSEAKHLNYKVAELMMMMVVVVSVS